MRLNKMLKRILVYMAKKVELKERGTNTTMYPITKSDFVYDNESTSITNRLLPKDPETGQVLTVDDENNPKWSKELPDITVGNAVNLQGTKDIVNSSMYHTTGNMEDVKYGTAEIQSIRGNAVAWNQLIDPIDNPLQNLGVTLTYLGSGKYSLVGTATATGGRNQLVLTNTKISIAAGHKILVWGNKSSNSASIFLTGKEFIGIGNINVGSKIYLIDKNMSEVNIGLNVSNGIEYNDIFSCTLFDLTLIYGTGKEPTTAEQFEADYQRWFGKPLTYEPYDAGSIRPVLATGIKTVGFNLYSGEDFNGTVQDWIKFNGGRLWINNCDYSGQICVNLDIVDNTNVKQHKSIISTPDKKVSYLKPHYGVDKVLIYIYFSNGTYSSYTIGDFTPKENTVIKISNICINFVWSGKRDGEYEPHWEETKALPLTTLTGKLNGEGESVVVFPDGMKRAGDVYDEIKVENGVTKAIKRVGSVDLGTATIITKYEYPDYLGEYYYLLSDKNFKNDPIKKGVANSISNISCSKYVPTYANDITYHQTTSATYNKSIAVTNIGGLYIGEPTIEDVETLIETLQGVILYYELAEPQEYILDNFSLPTVYRVDDFGTEQIIAPENSIAPTIITRYGINAVDTLRRLSERYVSKESDDNFLAKLGEATDSKWSKK